MPADLAPPAPAPGRFLRVLAALGASMGLGVVFTAALVGSVVAHLDTTPGRRTVRHFLNPVLGSLFQGKLEVGEIERLNLHGLKIGSVDAYDPASTRVIHVANLDVDADVKGIIKSALGSGDMVIQVARIHIDDVGVDLEPGEHGPTIGDVFRPRKPSSPEPAKPGGRAVRVALDHIEIQHVGAKGSFGPKVDLDAELSGTEASVSVGPGGVVVDVKKNHIAARAPVPKPLEADVPLRLEIGDDGLKIESGVDGTFGGVDVHVKDASMRGNHVHARVEVPHVTGEQIEGLIPSTPPPKIPLRVPVGVVVEADGDLPKINFKTTVVPEGSGSIEAEGTFDVAAPQTLDAKVTISKLDPRAALDDPTATPVDARAHVHLELGAEPKIDAEATTQAFTLAGQPIPGVDAKASLAHGVWNGTASVHEKGAPVEAKFSFDPKQGVRFEADARVASLRNVSRIKLPPGLEASAQVKVKGALKDGALDARVSGTYGGVKAPGDVEVGGGSIEGTVHGPLQSLEVDATVTGKEVRAGKYAWNDATVHARGPVTAPRVTADLTSANGDSVSVAAGVDAKQKAVTGVRVAVKRNGQSLAGNVARVVAAPGGVKVEGIDFSGDGIGGLSGGLRVVGKEIVGKLHGEDVDVAKLAKMAGLKDPVGGVANIDIALESPRPGKRSGHVAIEVVGGEAGPQLSGLSGVFTATFDGDEVRTDGLFRLISHADEHDPPGEQCDGAIAQLRITGGEAEIPGPLLDPATWRKVAGRVEIAADDWNLRCLAKRVPPLSMFVSEVSGKMTTRATIERKPGSRFPAVTKFLMQTHGLRVVGPPGAHADKPEWDSLYTDVKLNGRVDSDAAGAKLQILDSSDSDHPVVAEVVISTPNDLVALLDRGDTGKDILFKLPVTGRVTIDRRKITAFSSLPSFVRDRIPALAGDVALRGDVKGSIMTPAVAFEVKAWGLAQMAAASGNKPVATYGAWGMPVDVDVKLGYDGKAATLDAHVDHKEKQVLGAKASLDVPIADALAGRVKPKGGLTVHLASLPLGQIPYFEERSLRGHLSGDVALKGIGERPQLDIALRSNDLKVGHDLVYETRVDMKVPVAQEVAGGGLKSDATLAVDLVSKTGGEFHTKVHNAVTWLAAAVPTVDMTAPADIDLQAKAFSIAVAAPFIPTASVSRLDGTLDGMANVHFDRVDDPEKARMKVGLKLVHALFNVPSIGQELHDAEIEIAGGEKGELVMKDLSIDAVRGRLLGHGKAEFQGILPTKGEFHFEIPQDQAIPVVVGDKPLGDATGKIDISYAELVENKHKVMDVKVGIPDFRLTLSPALARDVQNLAPNPDVRIVQAPVEPEEERAPSGSRDIHVTIWPLRVAVQGKPFQGVDLNASIVDPKSAPFKILVEGGRARGTGEVHIGTGSRIELLGKPFNFDEATCTWSGDLGNPFVNAKLRWESPEGTIFVEFKGTPTPFTESKLTYSSANGMSVDHIKQVLLTGGESASAQASSNSGAPGSGMATALVASQLNAQLGHGLSTKVGTRDDGTLQPGLEYRAGQALIGVSTYDASGSNAGATTAGGAAPKGQHSLITVDWRFWKNWLLRGRVDVGSDQQTMGLDMLWQYRY